MRRSGQLGEDMALAHLKRGGMRLVERNYRAGHREIDLVMEDGPCLVFVEVKARSAQALAPGRLAVDGRKRANLIAAAEHYLLQREAGDRLCRFDVCEVELDSGRVEHFKNAFQL